MMPVTLTNGNVGSAHSLRTIGYRVNAELGGLGGSVSMIASCIDAISVTTTITFPGDNELTVRVSCNRRVALISIGGLVNAEVISDEASVSTVDYLSVDIIVMSPCIDDVSIRSHCQVWLITI